MAKNADNIEINLNLSSSNPLSKLNLSLNAWNKSVNKFDISPSSNLESSDWQHRQEKSLTPDCISVLCQTCSKKAARYTCPRCQALYCCVECYRTHDIPPTSPLLRQKHDDATVGGGKCTESFYRDRVLAETSILVKDQRNIDKVQNILNRFGETAINTGNDASIEPASTVGDLNDEDYDELMQLITTRKVKKQNSSISHDSFDGLLNDFDDSLLEKLPHHLRRKFENAVIHGKLTSFVRPWYPFWVSNTLITGCSEQNQDIEKSDRNLKLQYQKSLDEMLVGMKPFHEYFPINTSVPALQYNACELIFSTVLTLRIYNGCSIFKTSVGNESNQCIPTYYDEISAACTLLEASTVLSNDARFSNLSFVLSSCAEASTSMLKNLGVVRDISWMLLVKDILAITKQKRLVSKVLLCGMDILDHGYKRVKKHRKDRCSFEESKAICNTLRLAKKKFEFYVSWSLQMWDTAVRDEIVEGIINWIDDWTFNSADKSEILFESALDSILNRN